MIQAGTDVSQTDSLTWKGRLPENNKIHTSSKYLFIQRRGNLVPKIPWWWASVFVR
jgi:hypothetical protein